MVFIDGASFVNVEIVPPKKMSLYNVQKNTYALIANSSRKVAKSLVLPS